MKNDRGKGYYTIYIALVPRSNNTMGKPIQYILGFDTNNRAVRLFRVTLKVENGMSNTESVQYAHIHPATGKVQDVKFVDDQNIILAVVGECQYPLSA